MIRPGARGLFFGGASLPYDAEVEYLQSTGQESIIFPEHLNKNVIVDIDISAVAGATYPNSQAIMFGTNAGDWEWMYGKSRIFFGGTNISSSSLVGNAFHNVVMDATANANRFVLDGTTLISTTGTSPDRGPITLFAVNNLSGTGGTKVVLRIGRCKITVNGNLLYDLKPVRVKENGVNVGQFYNEVNGVFINSPTGAFGYGPDK